MTKKLIKKGRVCKRLNEACLKCGNFDKDEVVCCDPEPDFEICDGNHTEPRFDL